MSIHTKKRFKRVYIEITNICNLSCKFCPDTKRLKKIMDINDFKKIIEKVKNYTDIVYLHVKGEPLLHPDVDSIIDICNKNNLSVCITTNGVFINKHIDSLKKVRQINISLHSFIQNDNKNDDYFKNIFSSINDFDNTVSLRLWSNNYQDILKKIEDYYQIKIEEKKAMKLKNNIYVNFDEEFTWPSKDGKLINKNGKCLALKDQIAILVNGDVVPCCLDNDGDIILGNIFKENLDEILNKDLSKKVIDNFSKGIITCDLCKTCGFLKRLEKKRK